MAQISAADVSKLRKVTGAGMMDCKNALTESDGDFDVAIDIIRKKGQAVANKRADREASEGVALSKINASGDFGAVIALNCETDFVAKNVDFIKLAQQILQTAIDNKPADLEALKNLTLDGKTVAEKVIAQIGITGEKMELAYYDKIQAGSVIPYIHQGNKLATLVGFSKKLDEQAAKDVAMQVAAMNPVAIDKDFVSDAMKAKELEIGREQARQEGKPENMLDKIAEGKLNKFYKDSTLLNQEFIKDSKKTVGQYLNEIDKDLKVTAFLRYSLTL